MVETIPELPHFDQVEAYRTFVRSVPDLVSATRTIARMDAYSYRGFIVGCSGVFLNGEGEIVVESRGNSKREGQTKVCAEQKVLSIAETAGLVQAIGLVVVGTTDPVLIEEVTDIATPTLHSCVECQSAFVGSPSMHRSTLIVTAGLDDDKYQVMTAGQMHDYYALEPEALLDEPDRSGFRNWDAHVAAYDQLMARHEGHANLRRNDCANAARTAILYGSRAA